MGRLFLCGDIKEDVNSFTCPEKEYKVRNIWWSRKMGGGLVATS